MNVIFVLGAIFVVPLITRADTNFQSQINIEETVAQQLRQDLRPMLPEGSYSLIVSANVNKIRTREIAEGETFFSKTDTGESEEISLPGFRPESESKGEGARRERQSYKMVERDELTSLKVRLVIDEGVPEDVATTAQSLASQKIRDSFGSKGTVSVERARLGFAKSPYLAALPPLKPEKNDGELYWTEMLETIASVLMLALVFLIILRGIQSYLRRKRAREQMSQQPFDFADKKNAFSLDDQPDVSKKPYALPRLDDFRKRGDTFPITSKDDEGIPPARAELDNVLAELITSILEHPLYSRKFLTQLDSHSQSRLLQSFESSSLRTAFQSLFQLQEPKIAATKAPSDLGAATYAEKIEFIDSLKRELGQYRKLCDVAVQQRFGVLGLLSSSELSDLFAQLEIDEAAQVLKRIPKTNVEALLSAFDESKRAALAQALMIEKRFDSAALRALEEKLRNIAEEITCNSWLPGSTTDPLLDAIIGSSQDAKNLVAHLSRVEPQRAKRLAAFSVTLDSIDTFSKPELSRALGVITNEDLAFVMSSLSKTQKSIVLGALPEMRVRTIESIMRSVQNVRDESRIAGAQKNLLHAMRSQILHIHRKEGLA